LDRKKVKLIKGLSEFKERLNCKMHLEKIIFFGSFAKGTNHRYSDIDLIVISKNFQNRRYRRRIPELYDFWEMDYPVDFICYTPEEFKERSKYDSIARTAQKEGIVI
jgi:uncharacterized protein